MSYILLFCNSSLEEEAKYLYSFFEFGKETSFQFLRGYNIYILKGSINEYKQIDFNVKCIKNIYEFKYLFSDISYSYIDEINLAFFAKASPQSKISDNNNIYTFTASNSETTKYFYLLINITPFPTETITISVSSSFPSTPSEPSKTSVREIINLIIFTLIILCALVTCIVVTAKFGLKQGCKACGDCLSALR